MAAGGAFRFTGVSKDWFFESNEPVTLRESSYVRQPIIRAFFDEPTNTVSYLVGDPATRKAAIIDPVFNYEHNSGEVDARSVEAMLKASEEARYEIEWILETHAHADHLSGAPFIKAKTGAKIGIGEHIRHVQRIFQPIFIAIDLKTDGSDFDHLFEDGERFKIGELDAEVLYTPGHTPADISYRIEDAVFVGDTLFMPDYGTARADFPGGDAHKLYRSIKRLLALSSETRLFMCHDYKAPGRDVYAWETTVREERQKNIHLKEGITEDEFVAICAKRGTLSCQHQGCCCHQSKSTSVQENSRPLKPIGCTTSRFL